MAQPKHYFGQETISCFPSSYICWFLGQRLKEITDTSICFPSMLTCSSPAWSVCGISTFTMDNGNTLDCSGYMAIMASEFSWDGSCPKTSHLHCKTAMQWYTSLIPLSRKPTLLPVTNSLRAVHVQIMSSLQQSWPSKKKQTKNEFPPPKKKHPSSPSREPLPLRHHSCCWYLSEAPLKSWLVLQNLRRAHDNQLRER